MQVHPSRERQRRLHGQQDNPGCHHRGVQMHDERRQGHLASDDRKRAWRETSDGDEDKKPGHPGMEVALE